MSGSVLTDFTCPAQRYRTEYTHKKSYYFNPLIVQYSSGSSYFLPKITNPLSMFAKAYNLLVCAP